MCSGAFGYGPFLTFPYTPGFVHGEQIAYAVGVKRFADTSEQRYLLGRQRGLGLTYTFPFPSSGEVCGIRSFFLDMGGPFSRFLILDHRTKLFYIGRFAQLVFQQQRSAPMIRQLQVDFVTEQAGGTGP